MQEQPISEIAKLQLKLGYIFKNPKLLEQALTRQSAIDEKVNGATSRSYQGLEFVGDAALKHVIAKLLYLKFPNSHPEQLHDAAIKLIANKGILPEIARKLNLPNVVKRGNGELIMNDKMCADAMEAVLGAISIDNQSQEMLFDVIEKLWKDYLPDYVTFNQKTTKSTSPSPLSPPPLKLTNNHSISKSSKKLEDPFEIRKVDPTSSKEKLTPRTSRMFCSLSKNMDLETFENYVKSVPDVNRRNLGKKGDTALMKLLRQEKLRPNKEIPKIEILLKHGALWTVKNNKDETAERLAKNHDAEVIKKLKYIKPV